jgi:hypothetical protein
MDKLLKQAIDTYEQAEKIIRKAHANQQKADGQMIKRMIELIRKSSKRDYNDQSAWEKRLGLQDNIHSQVQLLRALTILKKDST